MRSKSDTQRSSAFGTAFALSFAIGLSVQSGHAAQPGAVDLLATPPEITASVAPNVLLTFDDSGSMAWQYMPDRRPYDNGNWVQSSSMVSNADNPWFCAGRIDAAATDPTDPRTKSMNGMYYDPNVTYRPPLRVDGVTEMPEPAFSLAWHNGILHNRPNAPIPQGTRNLATTGFCRTADPVADPAYYYLEFEPFEQDWENILEISTNDNWSGVPHIVGYASDVAGAVENVDPRLLTSYGTSTAQVFANASNALTTTGGNHELETGAEIAGNPTVAFQGDASRDAPYLLARINTTRCTSLRVQYTLRDLNGTSSAVQQVAVQARPGSSGAFTNFDYHPNANNNGTIAGDFTLPAAYDGQQRVQIRWITTNATGDDNMIGVDDIRISGNCSPLSTVFNAGWYRLKDTVTVTQDSYGRLYGDLAPAARATAIANMYDKTNWEFVPLPASQRQNFANWYSYYRTRNASAITAMSRAFAPFDESIRVAWQNLHTSLITDTTAAFGAQQNIFRFIDEAASNNVRTRFYNWLFQIPANNATPNIAATTRVGEFFKRGNGYDNDSDPYWDRTLNRELSCRQNFHINMSDGFWNGGNPAPPTAGAPATRRYLDSSTALPDTRNYNPADAETKFFNRYTGTQAEPNLADVMFHYWASDLRPDFAGAASTRLKVPPFIPDRSTTLFGIPLGTGQDARDNREIYWNPANDPATWPHMVSFNISFGLEGTLPQTQDVYEELRLGTGSTFIWPHPVVGTDDGRKLDDFWHAALVSRGRYLSAKNPQDLITALQEVIASIIARRGSSTAVSVSLPIITDGTTGYTAGYDTTDWAGFVTRDRLDPQTAASLQVLWDAGCKLTGGNCPATNQTGLPVRDPDSRRMITSSGTVGSGTPFRWNDLTSAQQARLNVEPTSIRLDLGTWTTDTYGDERLLYLRGSRVNETTASPRFRVRSSVLGAVIRGQPIYVSSPDSGLPDRFPGSSPETPYRDFQVAQRARTPTIYVAANDGALHAFNASDGSERWAYVPNTVIDNFRLTRSTQFEGGFTPSVDDKPLVTDVFINGQWRTVLLGSMRLGGRGVYLLDITNPPASSNSPPYSSISESALADTVPIWEFSNVAPAGELASDCATGARFCSSVGYVYSGVNIARLRHGNKWVALVSSGYFPRDSLDPASAEVAANRTSLLVIDLENGQLIREIRTDTAPQTFSRSFGLSQAIVLDRSNDFIDDAAFAGDLAGNLWRFDLSAANPSDWKVDLMFQTYGGGAAGLSSTLGDLPIASAPAILAQSGGRGPMLVFGSGKFLGLSDRTAAIPIQAFFGVKDYGACDAVDNPIACGQYPIAPGDLVAQTMTQAANAVRTITSTNPVTDTDEGWRLHLNISSEPGERSFGTPFPFFTANAALLYSIIPKGVDPCDPGARYGLMLVNAGNGTAVVDASETTPVRTVGGVVSSSTPPGAPVTPRGGGQPVISGIPPNASDPTVDAVLAALGRGTQLADGIWHRGAWREILDD